METIASIVESAARRPGVSDSHLLRLFRFAQDSAGESVTEHAYAVSQVVAAGARLHLYDHEKVLVHTGGTDLAALKQTLGVSEGYETVLASDSISEIARASSGEARAAAMRPVRGAGYPIPVSVDPVARLCEFRKACKPIRIDNGFWTLKSPEWARETPERVRLVAGDKAVFAGSAELGPARSGESVLEYAKRVRGDAKTRAEGIFSPSHVDRTVGWRSAGGFGYRDDLDWTRALRKASSANAESFQQVDRQGSEGDQSGGDEREGASASGKGQRGRKRAETDKEPPKRQTTKNEAASDPPELKALAWPAGITEAQAKSRLKKAESKCGKTKRSTKRSAVFVRVFRDIAAMEAALEEGLYDPSVDPTPKDIEGTTPEEAKRSANTKISRETAEDVARGGKLIMVGDRVVVRDGAQATCFRKARDKDGRLFWAREGVAAAGGIEACSPCDPKGPWTCDLEEARADARRDACYAASEIARSTVEALESPPTDEMRLRASSKRPDSGLVRERPLRLQGGRSLRTRPPDPPEGFVTLTGLGTGSGEFVGVANSGGLSGDAIPQQRARRVEISPALSVSVAKGPARESLRLAVSVANASLACIGAASVFPFGVNINVIKNMALYAATPVILEHAVDPSDVQTLRLVVTVLQFVVSYATLAAQIADENARDAASRDAIANDTGLAVRACDLSHFFPDRKALRGALDKRIKREVIAQTIQTALEGAPLLKGMLESPAPTRFFSLNNSGLSVRDWDGFRPPISSTGDNVYVSVRKNALQGDASLPRVSRGFSRKGWTEPLGSVDAIENRSAREFKIADQAKAKIQRDLASVIDVKGSSSSAETVDNATDYCSRIRQALRLFASDVRAKRGAASKSTQQARENAYKATLKAIPETRDSGAPVNDLVRSLATIADLMKRVDRALGAFLREHVTKSLAWAFVGIDELTARLESAREKRKLLQVSYVESLDRDEREAYIQQREIGVRLDETDEFDEFVRLNTEGDAAPEIDASHDFGDIMMENRGYD